MHDTVDLRSEQRRRAWGQAFETRKQNWYELQQLPEEKNEM
jgi:hypothetical protein